MQSSRSKWTTSSRRRHLLRFQSNSTATLDGGTQKLENDLCHDSDLIAAKFCSKTIANKKRRLKPWRGLHLLYDSQYELQFSIQRSFEQSATEHNHLLCYWPIMHNSISKVCPNFQVYSSYFFEVDDLLHDHQAKNVRRENISQCNPVEQKMTICPRLQVLTSHFSEVDDQLDENWVKRAWRKNIWNPIYVECDVKVCHQ